MAESFPRPRIASRLFGFIVLAAGFGMNVGDVEVTTDTTTSSWDVLIEVPDGWPRSFPEAIDVSLVLPEVVYEDDGDGPDVAPPVLRSQVADADHWRHEWAARALRRV